MTFEEQIIATLIGTLSAVLLGIVAFILTEWLRGLRKKKIIEKYLKNESKYNISIIDKWINKLNSLKEMTENTGHVLNSTEILLNEKFQSYFINASFENGLIYNKLDTEEISKLTSVMDDLNDWNNKIYENWINKIFKTHKDNKEERNRTYVDILKSQIENFKNYRSILNKLINKL